MPLKAQIALPDVPDQETEEPELSPPDEKEKTAEKELQEMIRELQGRQGLQVNTEEESLLSDADRSLLEKQEMIYETAPDMLKVSCELFSGERLWGQMKNRSFKVRNAAGDFPVLLHQLEGIKGAENQGVFIFDFVDGDRLQGVPVLQLMNLRLPEGGERIFRFNELKSLRVAEKEP